MANELDLRLVQIGIEVNGVFQLYNQDFDLVATGMKYANANQNECEIKISNLNKETRDFILTETSPFNLNRTPKRVTIDAGRVSYGMTRVFSGDVVTASPSQPPDIAVILKSLTGNYEKGNVVARNYGAATQLSQISQQVANDLGLSLDFQATDKQISNYNFTGGSLKQVQKLSDAGFVNAYVDNETLLVKNMNLPLSNTVTVLNIDTGMVGIPEITEQGVKVKFLLDGTTTLGGKMQLTSQLYPAVNGSYVIYKLGFEIASRHEPFYWIAEGKRL